MNQVLIIAGFALRESLRKRVFIVVALLTVAFLALYALGVWQISQELDEIGMENGVEGDVVAGATLLGLSMFATLFLGAILAVFLTLGAVRGDAERGLLQPLIVRPLTAGHVPARPVRRRRHGVRGLRDRRLPRLGRDHQRVRRLVARPADPSRARVGRGCGGDRRTRAGGSVVLSSTANGIAVFMLFGAGLTAGLLGQIAEALSSETLETVSRAASWALPFEALYLSALGAITSDTVGFTRFAINLGPFGGAQSFGALLGPFTVAYVAGIGAAALWAFRSDGTFRVSRPHGDPGREHRRVARAGRRRPERREARQARSGLLDGETDEPAFVAVKTGLVSKSITLVPLERASVGRDFVRVDRRKAVFKKAPSFDTDAELTLDDEAATYEHYSLSYTPAGEGARRLAKR